MKNIETVIDQSIEESIAAKRDFWSRSRSQFFDVGRKLVAAVRSDNKVLIFGNGGSACDALHFAGEWVNRFSFNRPPLPCIALTADAPLITCISNDDSFDAIFERQVLAAGRRGDVVIGITTSGNSKNVLRAFAAARQAGMFTVALVGGQGGAVVRDGLADITLNVAGPFSTPRIQETHEWILHSLSEYVEHEIYGHLVK